ncbi:CAP domain-containing protein [Pseudaestuariivita sp.]|uniref:CAP domain-containing protein n=1 Tax=Pseudaestuariivita sp. TaxID=2211669 RepID=UPI00405843E2
MRVIVALLSLIAVAACEPTTPEIAPDGQASPKLYKIRSADEAKIKFRMEDGVNALRQASGLGNVRLDSKLTAAAATHARDMSLQNRPWHFGSDGSSPIDRTRRVGYSGAFIGELISETYETELVTLGAWAEDPITRKVLLSPQARDLGFSWFQEDNGKIWWTLVLGGVGAPTERPAPVAIPDGTSISAAPIERASFSESLVDVDDLQQSPEVLILQ